MNTDIKVDINICLSIHANMHADIDMDINTSVDIHANKHMIIDINMKIDIEYKHIIISLSLGIYIYGNVDIRTDKRTDIDLNIAKRS